MICSRRAFINKTSSFATGLLGLQAISAVGKNSQEHPGYGKLLKDKSGILDLPKNFSYKIIGRSGEKMTDGFFLPGKPDGMAAFQGINKNEVVLIRNHEIDPNASFSTGPFGKRNEMIKNLPEENIYDRGKNSPCMGGTTTVVYNVRIQKVVRQFLSLTGTLRNCAGGPTPWDTWISCEETVVSSGGSCSQDHGWCFEVPVSEKPLLAKPVPLKAMGRFNHEAIAVEPESGDIYLTEDRHEGLLYKFVPKIRGQLVEGGKLYALTVKDMSSLDTRNWKSQKVKIGQEISFSWLELDGVDSPKDDLRFRGFRKGAACFARGEGMWYSKGSIYFACTNGGRKQNGQVWKITGEKLTLYAEPNDSDLVDNCDNITVAPWGDLILCEDGGGKQYLDVITPEGKIFKLAKNANSSGEFAGATFSPDGSTLFVNMQHDGLTLGITGPWESKLS
jgi:secreted PhoX family phosphatase